MGPHLDPNCLQMSSTQLNFIGNQQHKCHGPTVFQKKQRSSKFAASGQRGNWNSLSEHLSQGGQNVSLPGVWFCWGNPCVTSLSSSHRGSRPGTARRRHSPAYTDKINRHIDTMPLYISQLAELQITSNSIISWPNPMYDLLLESSRWDDSNKRSNIGFRQEMSN